MESIEQQISKQMFQKDREKTFVDKILAKDNIGDIRALIKKKDLTREDLLEILYLMASDEIKLLNLNEWERHILLKMFIWIRDFAKNFEVLCDYEDFLKDNPNIMSQDTKQLLLNVKSLKSHNLKFLIDLFLAICRSSLSIGATGILELLKSKFEVLYQNQQTISTPMDKEKTRFFGIGGKKQ